MKLIVGLGNPGTKYEHTRHNAGFLAIDEYLKDVQSINCQSSFKSQVCELHFGSNKIFFVKPQTFMNLSGEAIAEIANFYKVDIAKDLLVIHDEVDLPFGTIRATDSSSSAGHNGVQNIIDKLGTQNFHRIRIGVESRTEEDMTPTDAFVLQNFTDEETKKLQEEIFPKVKVEIERFIKLT